MSRQFPPLNPLRAFEASARHSSFTRAAEELCVTPSAVSHQVKTLEDYLGAALFVRDTKSLVLTAAGRAYLPSVQQAFSILADGTRQLQTLLSPSLRIDVPPTFAAKWLIPRMDRFVRAYPEIDLKVSTLSGVPDFSRGEFDMAIRFGRGIYPGLHSEAFLSVEVFPVCSPALMAGAHPLKTPEDLRHHTLLHDNSTYADSSNPHWSTWLRHVGAAGVDATRGLSFSPTHLVINAAIDGLGVALTKNVWVEEDLAQGRLVRPFAAALPVEFSYYLVYPHERANDVRIATFVDWLREETKRPQGA